MTQRSRRESMEKTISQFLPLAASDPGECDRYYREVHTRFARGFLRQMEHVQSYHIAQAEAAYDLNGAWLARPETFRYVTLRFAPGHGLALSPSLRYAITEDHRIFLRELRGFEVEEDIVLDRLCGQTSLVKYLFEFDHAPDESMRAGASRLQSQIEELGSLANEAFGIRLLLVDHVRTELRSDPVDEPGQRSTGEALPTTTRQAFVEMYFDQDEWAEDWFARPDVRSALVDRGWDRVHGVRVAEACGLDRRVP